MRIRIQTFNLKEQLVQQWKWMNPYSIVCVMQLRLVFTSNRVRVRVVIRSIALNDLVKTAF